MDIVLRFFNISFNVRRITVALSVLIIGPLFGIYSGYKTDRNLKIYGVETEGIVYRKWHVLKSNDWLLRCNFKAQGKIYSTFSETDRFTISW